MKLTALIPAPVKAYFNDYTLSSQMSWAAYGRRVAWWLGMAVLVGVLVAITVYTGGVFPVAFQVAGSVLSPLGYAVLWGFASAAGLLSLLSLVDTWRDKPALDRPGSRWRYALRLILSSLGAVPFMVMMSISIGTALTSFSAFTWVGQHLPLIAGFGGHMASFALYLAAFIVGVQSVSAALMARAAVIEAHSPKWAAAYRFLAKFLSMGVLTGLFLAASTLGAYIGSAFQVELGESLQHGLITAIGVGVLGMLGIFLAGFSFIREGWLRPVDQNKEPEVARMKKAGEKTGTAPSKPDPQKDVQAKRARSVTDTQLPVKKELEDGMTLLMAAINQENYPAFAQLINEPSTDVNAADDHGYTALDYARDRLSPDVKGNYLPLLADQGAKTKDQLSADHSNTPDEIASELGGREASTAHQSPPADPEANSANHHPAPSSTSAQDKATVGQAGCKTTELDRAHVWRPGQRSAGPGHNL